MSYFKVLVHLNMVSSTLLSTASVENFYDKLKGLIIGIVYGRDWLLGCRRSLHFPMLSLDGVYVERPDGSLRFRCEKAPTSAELTRRAQTLALRVGRSLERQGLVEWGVENSCLAG